jgi:hypothetical protein
MDMVKPIEFLKAVIRGDTPERVSAFLAVISGIALVIGFLGLVVAITVYHQKLTTELLTISGALVTLATFSKVDQNTITSTTQSVITKNDNTNTTVTVGPTAGATGVPGPVAPPVPPPVKAPGVGSDD